MCELYTCVSVHVIMYICLYIYMYISFYHIVYMYMYILHVDGVLDTVLINQQKNGTWPHKINEPADLSQRQQHQCVFENVALLHLTSMKFDGQMRPV